jgi:AbrB family looped-hinge helix DNA binding protein
MSDPFQKWTVFGTVKVGERGQIVIPAKARRLFNIKHGDLLLVVGNKEGGMGLFFIKAEKMKEIALSVLSSIASNEES